MLSFPNSLFPFVLVLVDVALRTLIRLTHKLNWSFLLLNRHDLEQICVIYLWIDNVSVPLLHWVYQLFATRSCWIQTLIWNNDYFWLLITLLGSIRLWLLNIYVFRIVNNLHWATLSTALSACTFLLLISILLLGTILLTVNNQLKIVLSLQYLMTLLLLIIIQL